MKKGQITTFVILGIIILLTLYISFIAKHQFAYTTLSTQEQSLQSFLHQCLSTSLSKVTRIDLELNEDYEKKVHATFVAASNEFLSTCLDYSTLPFIVEVKEVPRSTLRMNDNDVTLFLETDIESKEENQEFKITFLREKVPLRALLLTELLDRLVEAEARGYFLEYTILGSIDTASASEVVKTDITTALQKVTIDSLPITHQQLEDITIQFRYIPSSRIIFKNNTLSIQVEIMVKDERSGVSVHLLYPTVINQMIYDTICDITDSRVLLSAQDNHTYDFVNSTALFQCKSYACEIGNVSTPVSYALPKYCLSPSIILSAEGYSSESALPVSIMRVLLERTPSFSAIPLQEANVSSGMQKP